MLFSSRIAIVAARRADEFPTLSYSAQVIPVCDSTVPGTVQDNPHSPHSVVEQDGQVKWRGARAVVVAEDAEEEAWASRLEELLASGCTTSSTASVDPQSGFGQTRVTTALKDRCRSEWVSAEEVGGAAGTSLAELDIAPVPWGASGACSMATAAALLRPDAADVEETPILPTVDSASGSVVEINPGVGRTPFNAASTRHSSTTLTHFDEKLGGPPAQAQIAANARGFIHPNGMSEDFKLTEETAPSPTPPFVGTPSSSSIMILSSSSTAGWRGG